jgi:hypothetical protein
MLRRRSAKLVSRHHNPPNGHYRGAQAIGCLTFQPPQLYGDGTVSCRRSADPTLGTGHQTNLGINDLHRGAHPCSLRAVHAQPTPTRFARSPALAPLPRRVQPRPHSIAAGSHRQPCSG